MRLWHKELIAVLPRRQLLGQWRECCLIAKRIMEKGTPNHILVNQIMEYPVAHFIRYSREVFYEMKRRSYRCEFEKLSRYLSKEQIHLGWNIPIKGIFPDWHNDRYLRQCFYNLQEKYDCGAISLDEYGPIREFVDTINLL